MYFLMKTVFYIALWFLLAFFCSKRRFFSKKKPWKDYIFILFKTVFFLKKNGACKSSSYSICW